VVEARGSDHNFCKVCLHHLQFLRAERQVLLHETSSHNFDQMGVIIFVAVQITHCIKEAMTKVKIDFRYFWQSIRAIRSGKIGLAVAVNDERTFNHQLETMTCTENRIRLL